MTLTEDIYLNCGIYSNQNGDMLFIAIPGYFASAAWCKSDEAYNDVLGRKFEAITADDGLAWTLERNDIRRLTPEDNLEELYNNSCEDFKQKFKDKFLYE